MFSTFDQFSTLIMLLSVSLLVATIATATSQPRRPQDKWASTLSESSPPSSRPENGLLEILHPSPEPSLPTPPQGTAHTVIFNLASPPAHIKDSIASVLALPDLDPGLAHYLNSYNMEAAQHHRKVVDAMEAVQVSPIALLHQLRQGPEVEEDQEVQILAKINLFS